MPKAFENCRAKGGRIRTEKPSPKTYRPVCYDEKGRHPGHKKKNKK